MKNLAYLTIIAISLMWGCQKFEVGLNDNLRTSISNTVVERTEDGRYKVTAQFKGESMTSVVTRASEKEDAIYDGWCLVFGEDQDNVDKGEYTDDSPLIQIEKVSINSDGSFTMVFDEYPHTAFMRIVVNLTDRENNNFSSLQNGSSSDGYKSWRAYVNAHPDAGLNLDTPPTKQQVEDFKIATFGEYRHQSVGLDGIYNIAYDTKSNLVNGTFLDYTKPDGTPVYVTSSMQYTTEGGSAGTSSVTGLPETYNKNQPNPTSSVITTNDTGFPMASYGFELAKITEESLKEAFGKIIYMIRTCSKVQVDVEDSNFKMDEVYLIGAAQEARIRSTTLSEVTTDADGNTTTNTTNFDIPADLGGAIDYAPLTVTNGKTSDPIYFYPNSGGDYEFNNGVVDQDVNPQYIIIKGQSTYYDTPGYYKVALKAQYPLANDSDASNMGDENKWSPLTYDILRNTSFTVKLLSVDKPGYKTYEDAADPNSPANNISYSLDINTSNNHYEILVSNGTYYVELSTSRIYAKGYGTEGIEGDKVYVDFSMLPSNGNVIPSVYIQSSDYDNNASTNNVEILNCKVLREGDSGYDTNDWSAATQITSTTNNTGDGLADKLVSVDGSDVSDSDGDGSNVNEQEAAMKKPTKFRVYFKATNSGRIRLRIGDILKFIPVVYDSAPASYMRKKLEVKDEYNTSCSDFSYKKDADIEISLQTVGNVHSDTRILTSDGYLSSKSNVYQYSELYTRLYTADNSGIAQLYLKQASDFNLQNGTTTFNVDAGNTYDIGDIAYSASGAIYNDETDNDNISISNRVASFSYNGAEDVEMDYGDIPKPFNWNRSGRSFTVTASDLKSNNAYIVASKKDMFLDDQHNNSVITLSNDAGDIKKYTLYQKQYTPAYFLSGDKTDLTWNMQGSKNCFIRTVNIYNTRLSYSSMIGVGAKISYTNESKGSASNYLFNYFMNLGLHDPDEIGATNHDQADDEADLWCQVWRDGSTTIYSKFWSTVYITAYDKFGEEYKVSFRINGN